MACHLLSITILIVILCHFTTTLPTESKNPFAKEETVAIYVPYDVKYVPVEVPESVLNVEPLNSKSSSLQSIVLKKADILKHFSDGDIVKPIIGLGETGLRKDELVVVPLSVLSGTLSAKADLDVAPLKTHRLSKRQVQRFPFYRPVFRLSRISSSRRRGMVGYLSDRDYFPTVA